MAVCPRSLADLVECDLNTIPLTGWRRHAGQALLKSITKKLVTDRHESARAKALSLFLESNNKCSSFVLRVDSSWDEELVGTFKRVLYDFFYPRGMPLISELGIFDRCRTGPGLSVGTQHTTFYGKLFSSPLTATRRYIVDLYRSYSKYTPSLYAARKGSERVHGYTYVDCSRLTTVPKQNDIDRVICIEPSLNMYFQLGLGGLLEERLRGFFGIDLALQPDRNRELARQGALYGTFSTIDLKSASDSISMELCRRVLPKDVLDWFTVFRSPACELPDGSQVPLQMMSTMGNGFTFPLQTLLFAAMVKAVAIESGGLTSIRNPSGNVKDPSSKLGNWGVFGDDIIVETKLFPRLRHLLHILGFTPNLDKSFSEGPFRESCGADWYEGQPVRGVYIKDLSTVQSRFTAINSLNDWTAKTGIPLPNTVRYLLESVPYLPVPFNESGDAGVRVPSSHFGGLGRAPVSYRCFSPEPLRLSARVGPLLRRKVTYNSQGLYLAFLRGEIRADTFVVRRSGNSMYRYKRKMTPNWDRSLLVGEDQLLSFPWPKNRENWYLPSPEWQRWKTAVETNIG